MKKVKGSYITKSGEKHTYSYEYDKKYSYKHKSTKGKVLVNAKGKVNTKNVEAFKKQIMASSEGTVTERKQLCNRLDAYIEVRKSKDNLKEQGKLTTNGFYAHMKKDKAEKFAASLGYTTKELAAMYNIEEDDLNEPANWKGDFLYASGRIFRINHNYTGDVLIEE